MKRTAIVVTLLAVAVLAPSGAWWVSGSRAAEARAASLRRAAMQGLQEALASESGRLASRLESLRSAEGRRPFYHYQNLYHDPRGATEGLSVVPSPLAAGTTDPLVGVHFQIDADGRVSLPTVNEDFPELSTEQGFAAYCAFLADLEEALVVEPVAAGSGQPQVVDAGEEHRLVGDNRGHVVVLGRSQWQQIERANEVYALIAERRGGRFDAGARAIAAAGGSEERVAIHVGPLSWHTVLVSSGPVLAALRQVETPAGVLVQGLTVAGEAFLETVAGEAAPLALRPDPPADASRLWSPVGDTGWYLATAATDAVHEQQRQAVAVVEEFRRTFALFFVAALVAAGCVAAIVVQADRLARQRTRFAAAAAHELKTPLSTLRLYSEMLAEDLGNPDSAATYAARIATESARLGRVVVNILDLSRLERGAPLVQPVEGDLAEAVARCVEGLRPALAETGLSVSTVFDDDLPRLAFDADAVCQIVTNLLDNGERYTRGVDQRRVQLRLTSAGGWARLVVADNGPGVAETARRHLFRPFARGAAADAPAGLGLGLALGRSLARAHGGDLRLVSQGEGAAFELMLPIGGARVV